MTPYVLAGLLAVGSASCAVDHPELGSTAGVSFEELRARLPREPGTGAYIVDWDLVLHGDDALRELYDQLQPGALTIATSGGVDVRWTETQQRELTYCISDAFGDRKQAVIAAMKAASDDGWERFADVDFVYVPAQDASCTAQTSSVVFDVNPISGASYLARAFFPSNGRSTRNLIIDDRAFDPQATGRIPLANVLAHELGHTLGFRHEHIRPEANAVDCAEDGPYREVTTYDAASVMHYPQCNGTSSTLAFTERDRQGAASVYGAPGEDATPLVQLTSPGDGAIVRSSFTVEASIVDADLVRAELLVDDALYQALTAPPFRFDVAGLGAGVHLVAVRATDAHGQAGAQTITVTVADEVEDRASPGEDAAGVDDASGGCSTTGDRSGLVIGLGVVAAGLTRRRRR